MVEWLLMVEEADPVSMKLISSDLNSSSLSDGGS